MARSPAGGSCAGSPRMMLKIGMNDLGYQPPVIVVHAITGSVLRDEYPVDPENVWDPSAGFRVRDFLRIGLHPDDVRFEAEEPARVRAAQMIELIYRDLIESLRYDLSPSEERRTPVYPFVYDWRQDNVQTARQLGEFIVEVIERTNLIKHYERKCACVDLVGHSMGGIAIGACLALQMHRTRTGRSRVRRVVTVGTPFRGSVDAIEKMSTGESEIVGVSSNRERETARLTPSLYQLLPSWIGGLVDADDRPLDIYQTRNWQFSVVQSLMESLRLRSARRELQGPEAESRRRDAALGLLADLLTRAQTVHDLLSLALDPREALLEDGRGKHPGWLLIVGEDERTFWRARLLKGRFQCESTPPDVDEPDREEQLRRRRLRGDGTVPLSGAVPDWADPQAVVAVNANDFRGTELRDRFLRAQLGLHSTLPLMNVVQRWVISFLRDEVTGELYGRRLPGLARWEPPFAGTPRAPRERF